MHGQDVSGEGIVVIDVFFGGGKIDESLEVFHPGMSAYQKRPVIPAEYVRVFVRIVVARFFHEFTDQAVPGYDAFDTTVLVYDEGKGTRGIGQGSEGFYEGYGLGKIDGFLYQCLESAPFGREQRFEKTPGRNNTDYGIDSPRAYGKPGKFTMSEDEVADIVLFHRSIDPYNIRAVSH